MQGYSETQITEWIALAQEVGITRAKRELGYPKAWITGKKWAEARGITLEVDDIKAKAAGAREFYKQEEKLVIGEEELSRIHLALQDDALNADDLKKLADAYKRTIEAMNLVEGKATNISEQNTTDAFDSAYQRLVKEEQGQT